MRFDNHGSLRVFAWQNLLAAAVFTTLVAGDCVAFFLHAYPSSEILWRMSIPLRRLTSAFSDVLGNLTGNNPAVPFLLLACCVAVPLWAYCQRHLMTTAILGHAALGGCVLMLATAFERTYQSRTVADLSSVLDSSILTTSTVTLGLAAIAMLVLCGLNHVIYFRQFSLRDK